MRLAHEINQALGNVGKTVVYSDPVDANPVNRGESLKALVDDMRSGKVDMLLILGGNPAYDAPAELEFASALKSNAVGLKVCLSSHRNETAELCQWHVPEAHYLESWSDARAYDGTVSIIQPLIEPLYGGKTAHEIVAILAGQSGLTGHDLVQQYWQKQHTGADFRRFLAQVAARRLDRRHGLRTQECDFESCQFAGNASPHRAMATSSTSAAIPRSTMAVSQTTAGYRNFPSR